MKWFHSWGFSFILTYVSRRVRILRNPQLPKYIPCGGKEFLSPFQLTTVLAEDLQLTLGSSLHVYWRYAVSIHDIMNVIVADKPKSPTTLKQYKQDSAAVEDGD